MLELEKSGMRPGRIWEVLENSGMSRKGTNPTRDRQRAGNEGWERLQIRQECRNAEAGIPWDLKEIMENAQGNGKEIFGIPWDAVMDSLAEGFVLPIFPSFPSFPRNSPHPTAAFRLSGGMGKPWRHPGNIHGVGSIPKFLREPGPASSGSKIPFKNPGLLPHPRNFGRRLLLIPGLLSPSGRVFPTGIPPLGRSREFPRSPQPRMLQSGQNSQNIPFIHSLESFGSGSYPSRSRNPPRPPGTAAPVPHLGMEKTAEKSGKNRECHGSGRPRAPRESLEF